MAATLIKGTVPQVKDEFTTVALVGIETIDASLLAGEIGIIYDSGATIYEIDKFVERLRDRLREEVSQHN